MKKSLRTKLSLFLMAFVMLTMLMSVLLSGVFLKDYYMLGKKEALVNTYDDINKIYTSELQSSSTEQESDENTNTLGAMNNVISGDLYLQLEQVSQNKNLSVLIYRNLRMELFNYSITGQNTKLMLYSSLGMTEESRVESSKIYTDYIDSQEQSESSFGYEGNYSLKQVYVKRLGASYIYLDGTFENGDHILIRASVEGITESVGWSNRFFLYITVIVGILGFVVMYFVTKHYLQPITQLTNMAEKMSTLDFAAKYQVETEDEIGRLGTSINVLSETLEQTLGELKAANAELKKDIQHKEEIDMMRKEFLSNVSHELKTPIALIQGYAEGLSENINEDEESRDFYCEVIIDEANKMNNMVKKIMALNQLEFGYGHVSMEHFDIVSMIQAVVSKSDILLKQKEVALIFDTQREIMVWSDAYMCEEIFTNYFTNALNHVDDDRKIVISITEEGDIVRIGVFNTGDRIPQEDILNIWDKFYKVDKARTREYGGSGVGLSIVKASMELLGQNYGVINREDGVEFWFELDSKNS